MSELKCSNCGATNRSSREAAEFVLGWRFWAGETYGGKRQEVSLCPTCTGCSPQPEKPDPGWGWECHTCRADYDPWDDKRPLTEKQARQSAEDHQCEPDISVYKIEPEKPAVVTVQPLAGVL